MTAFMLLCIATLVVSLLLAACSPEQRLRLAVLAVFLSGGTGQLPGPSATAMRGFAIMAAAGAAIGLGHRPVRERSFSLGTFALMLTLMLTVPPLAHGEVSGFASSLIGTALLLLLSFSAQRINPTCLINSFNAGVWTIIGLSTPLLALPSLGTVGGNFRGITANSNSLGIYCVLATISSLFLVKASPLKSTALACCAIALCIASHSRTSLISIAILIIMSMALRENISRRLIGAAITAGVLVSVAAPKVLDFVFGGVVNKTRGTRDQSWLEAQRAWDHSKLFGLGPSNIYYEIASSPLRAIAEGGLAMLFFYTLAIGTLLYKGIRLGPCTLVVAITASIHSLGEGWLISTTGPWVLAFSCAILAVMARDSIDQQFEGLSEGSRA